MRASVKLLYALTISAGVSLFTACGTPPTETTDGGDTLCADGKADDPNCVQPDAGPTPAITKFAVAGEPDATSVGFDIEVIGQVRGLFIIYWEKGHDGEKWGASFDSAPYVLSGLTPKTWYQAYAMGYWVRSGGQVPLYSMIIEFQTATGPCEGFVVPLATKCAGDFTPVTCVWQLYVSDDGKVCYLGCAHVGSCIMLPEYSGAEQVDCHVIGVYLLSCTMQ